MKKPCFNEELAEFIGIILGDGHIENSEINKNYNIDIAGHLVDDYAYITNHVTSIIYNLFNLKPKYKILRNSNCLYVRLQGKKTFKFMVKKGLKPGNKKKNNQGIPSWIFTNDQLLKSCIRGLFDTDGSVYLCGNGSLFPRIGLDCSIPRLREDISKALQKLGYRPFQKWVLNKKIAIYRKEDVVKYINDIGFKNPKHLKRFNNLCSDRLARPRIKKFSKNLEVL